MSSILDINDTLNYGDKYFKETYRKKALDWYSYAVMNPNLLKDFKWDGVKWNFVFNPIDSLDLNIELMMHAGKKFEDLSVDDIIPDYIGIIMEPNPNDVSSLFEYSPHNHSELPTIFCYINIYQCGLPLGRHVFGGKCKTLDYCRLILI